MSSMTEILVVLLLMMMVYIIYYKNEKRMLSMLKEKCICEDSKEKFLLFSKELMVGKCMKDGKWEGRIFMSYYGVDGWMIHESAKINYCPICGRKIE